MMLTAECERCGALVSAEDDDAGHLELAELTDDAEPSCSTTAIGNLCGNCVRMLKAWIQSGGKKPKVGQRP